VEHSNVVDVSGKNGFGFGDVFLTGEVRLENCKSMSILLEEAETLLPSKLHAANSQRNRRQKRVLST